MRTVRPAATLSGSAYAEVGARARSLCNVPVSNGFLARARRRGGAGEAAADVGEHTVDARAVAERADEVQTRVAGGGSPAHRRRARGARAWPRRAERCARRARRRARHRHAAPGLSRPDGGPPRPPTRRQAFRLAPRTSVIDAGPLPTAFANGDHRLRFPSDPPSEVVITDFGPLPMPFVATIDELATLPKPSEATTDKPGPLPPPPPSPPAIHSSPLSPPCR